MAKLTSAKRSGNVFADLGLPNPQQELLKARLALQIYKIINVRPDAGAGRGGARHQAAARLDADAQPRGQRSAG